MSIIKEIKTENLGNLEIETPTAEDFKRNLLLYLRKSEEHPESKKYKTKDRTLKAINEMQKPSIIKINPSHFNIFGLGFLFNEKNYKDSFIKGEFKVPASFNIKTPFGFKMVYLSLLISDEVKRTTVILDECNIDFFKEQYEELGKKENIDILRDFYFMEDELILIEAIERMQEAEKRKDEFKEIDEINPLHWIYEREKHPNGEDPRELEIMRNILKGTANPLQVRQYEQQMNEIIKEEKELRMKQRERATELKQQAIEQEDYFMQDLLI